MGMGDLNKSKFVFSETFNNKDGKTSGSGFIGVLLGMAAVLMAVAGTFGYFFGIEETLDFLAISVKFVGYSIILLGARKVVGEVFKGKEEKTDPPVIQENPEDFENEKG